MQIWLIISFLILFVLSRTVWVRIIKEEQFRVELHLPLIAVHLIDDKKKEKDNYTKYKTVK